MPNGRPGDHPYTDIVVHNSSSEFGAEISGLVREMARAPGFDAEREEVVAILEAVSFHPRPDDWDAMLERVLAQLREIKARLGR